MKYFVVIDMQNDFCTGALENSAAVAIIPRIKEELDKAREDGCKIIYTRDTHYDNYLKTGEGKHLPVAHCIRYTDGWEIVNDLAPKENDTIINKEHFGFDKWADYIKPNSEVTMVGTCTDICVVSNALAIKQIEGVEVKVIADACAGLSPETHKSALDTMKCCQCVIV